MTSRERVYRAVEFNNPPRIPLSSPLLESSDMVRVFAGGAEDFTPSVPGESEWGWVMEKRSDLTSCGYPTVHPLKDWDNYSSYSFPDPCARGRFDGLRKRFRDKDPLLNEKFIYAGIGVGPLTLCSFLLGFENFLFTLAANPERIRELVDRYHDYLSAMVKQAAEFSEIDAVLVYDDSAMQTGPFFSMDMWRDLFKPSLKGLCELTHSYGKKFFLHCCGNLCDHAPEFAVCGVDILDNKQPLLWLDQAEKLKGQITFHTCLDFTTFRELPQAEIKPRIRELIRRTSLPQGGFIGTMNNTIDPDVPAEKVEAVWNAYRKIQLETAHACTA